MKRTIQAHAPHHAQDPDTHLINENGIASLLGQDSLRCVHKLGIARQLLPYTKKGLAGATTAANKCPVPSNNILFLCPQANALQPGECNPLVRNPSLTKDPPNLLKEVGKQGLQLVVRDRVKCPFDIHRGEIQLLHLSLVAKFLEALVEPIIEQRQPCNQDAT